MPSFPPDLDFAATPLITTIEHGTVLWRIHSSIYGGTQYNPRIPGVMSGGRFDATNADTYPYLYAGGDTIAAVAETLLRDRPSEPMVYQVPFVKLRDKTISKLEISTPLEVVKLHGGGFHALGQSDHWLTSCGAGEYEDTRLWAQAIRRWSPVATGIEYRPRHDDDRLAYLFFGDRCPTGAFNVLNSYPMGIAGVGFTLVKRAAGKLNAVLRLPR
ncbi:MAG: RES family NAD+ phosphorylase [Deltaproteobacteria bacterium]|nr:RES family NAD+ phosphorylase [Deltaproteobacteria bacterium]